MKYSTQTLLALAITGLVALPGCSTSSDTTVDTNEQARDASASGTQSANLASNSGNLLFTGSEAGLVAVPAGGGSPAAPRLKTFSGSTSDQFTKIAALRNPAVATKTKNVVSRSVSRARSLAKSTTRTDTITINEPGTCEDSGTYTATGTWNEAEQTFSITVVFNACREGGHELNGPVAFTGTHDVTAKTFSGSATAGDDDGVLEPAEDLFARKFEEFEGDPYGLEVANLVEDLTYDFSFTDTSPAGNPNVESTDFSMSADGALRYTDVASGNSATVTYTNLSFAGSHSEDNGETPESIVDDINDTSVTTNGGISLDAPLIDIDISYTDFRLTEHEDGPGGYEDYTIDGTVSTDYTPDICNEGTFTFVTLVPVREISTGTIQGYIQINDNVDVVFNADGTITVTVAGSDPVTYDSWEDLENHPRSCPIPDFE